LISANRNHGSSRKVPDIEIIHLPLFVLIYDLVNYEIQFQEVPECAFINDSKGGVECGVVDLPLQPKFFIETSDEKPLFFRTGNGLTSSAFMVNRGKLWGKW
jgi:hypothetical protein